VINFSGENEYKDLEESKAETRNVGYLIKFLDEDLLKLE
jgi:hypothetical protein